MTRGESPDCPGFFVYNKDMAKETPVRSPSLRAHRRQFFWQILMPMVLVVLLVLAAGGFVVASGTSDPSAARSGADVAIIWLVAPFLILALLFIVLLGFAIYGLAKLAQVTPRYTSRLQDLVAGAAGVVSRIAEGITKPLLWLKKAGASAQALLKKA